MSFVISARQTQEQYQKQATHEFMQTYNAHVIDTLSRLEDSEASIKFFTKKRLILLQKISVLENSSLNRNAKTVMIVAIAILLSLCMTSLYSNPSITKSLTDILEQSRCFAVKWTQNSDLPPN